VAVLQENLQGKVDFKPMFIQGIELYLSEPVSCDDQMLESLFILWQLLQGIELARRIGMKYLGDTIALEKASPHLKQTAQDALPLAIKLCKIVDEAIENMKPLECASL
jgi:hypothetical protein